MHTLSLRLPLWAALGVLGIVLSGVSAAQAQLVTVELASGRSFTAAVSPQTNDTHLWLQFEGASSSLLRPVEWESVQAAWVDDEPIEIADLQQRALEFSPPAFVHVRRPVQPEAVLEEISPTESASHAVRVEEVLLEPAIVRSLDFDAVLANWDADVEMDGLELRLYPQDGWGCILPCDGTLQVELIAPMYRNFDARPQGQGRAMQQIGRWTRTVRIEDFGPSGTRVRLPFQAIHPEFDMDAGRMGLVHVRLAVAGAGVFEASHDPVRIRAYAPTRDNLQRVEHRRFFPSENTSRGQLATP